MLLRRVVLALAAVAALAAVVPAGASAEPAAVMRTDVQIKKFVVTHAGLTALGTAEAHLAGADARQQVTFSVARGSTCTILTLNLQQLHLQLLGLDLVTSAINLRITGETSRTLGQLFCKLATGLKLSKALSARKAAASLNHYMKGHPMHVLRVRAWVAGTTAQAAQAAPSCKVLDLVLGPLNLDLLGLVVDLYGPTKTTPVEVHVTADPSGGVLGSVFCKLANGQAAG
jgi:hypothetical protein